MPVDIATGTLVTTGLDFRLPGLIPLVVERRYSTAPASADTRWQFGPGWRLTGLRSLRRTLEGLVYIDGDGGEIQLHDDGELARGGRLIDPGQRIEVSGDGTTFELREYATSARQIFRFVRVDKGREFRLASVRVTPANRVDFRYDGRGRIVAMQQVRSGRAYEFVYDELARIHRVDFTLAGHRETVAGYEYDAAGMLARVRDPGGIACAYEYDHRGRMVVEQRRGGMVYTYRYDGSDRCIHSSGTDGFEERRLTFDVAKRTTTVVDSHGAPTRYTYNDRGQVIRVQTALETETHHEFDALGRALATVDAVGTRSAVEYDAWGHIAAAEYPDGRKLRIEYTAQHVPRAMVDVHDRRWTYEYDEHNQLRRSLNPKGVEWRYAYNEFGELVEITAPSGARQQIRWDPQGNLAGHTGPDGDTWVFESDRYGREIAARDPVGAITRSHYDGIGCLVAVEQADGSRWTYRYDDGFRPIETRAPDGSTLRVRYNPCGNPLEIVAADGGVMRFTWDTEPGRVLTITDALGDRIEYDWDALGHVTRRRNWDGAETRFERDGMGAITAVLAADGQRYEFVVDAWGLCALRREPDGSETRYSYDENGVLLGIDGPHGKLEIDRDMYGRVVAERFDGVEVRAELDVVGNITRIEAPDTAPIDYRWSGGCRCTAIEYRGDTLAFTRDAAGRELGRALPGGGSIQQRWDLLGRPVDQWYVPPGWDPQGPQPTPSLGGTPAPFRRQLAYDALGRLRAIVDALRGSSRFSHDDVGRLVGAIYGDGSSEWFEHDVAGNRRVAARAPAGRAPEPGAVLTRDVHGRTALELGRLQGAGASVERHVRGDGNRVVALSRGDREIRYEFDALGRVVRKHVEHLGLGRAEVWTYRWDGLGQLVELETPEGALWRYRYDGLGRRRSKQGPAGTTAFVWFCRSLVRVIEPDGRATVFVPELERRATVLRDRDDERLYVVPDHLGSPSELVDAAGRLRWAARHDAWGRDADADQPLRFPGQWLDEESGLHYNGYRYYDPELGRFISPDPIGLIGGFNEYAYAPTPLTWFDPDGLVVTGGPYGYGGGNTGINNAPPNTPNIVGNRTVTNPRSGESNAVPPPSAATDSGGKTLAVLQEPGGHNREAFVSGHGRPIAASPGQTHGWGTSTHAYGNWCHAEMHGMAWLRFRSETGNLGGATHFQLFIDRPPCSECDASLRAALAELRGQPHNLTLDVFYHTHNPGPGEHEGWNRFPPPQSHGGCGGH